MATDPAAPSRSADDGVRIADARDVRHDVWLVVALAVAAIGLVVGTRALVRRGTETQPAAAVTAEAPAAIASRIERADPVAPAGAPVAAPAPAAPAGAERPAAVHARRRTAAAAPAADTQSIDAGAAIAALRAAGETAGIAVFPPPGTDPPKRGIVVPEEFVLPEGFVRHYQTTDDGVQLPAILMFSPDYEWVDARGARVELPADRIVPPEMAPPGLPLRMLDLPGAKTPPGPKP